MTVHIVGFPARLDGVEVIKRPSKAQFYRGCSLRLGVLRRHLGHTPGSLAAELGMTKRAYSAYERGERSAQGWTRMLHRFLGLNSPNPVSLDWLFLGKHSFSGGERDDSRPEFQFPDHQPQRARPVITGRSGNLVTVDFIGAS